MPENSFCKYYSRMENLIKSNENHNYCLALECIFGRLKIKNTGFLLQNHCKGVKCQL